MVYFLLIQGHSLDMVPLSALRPALYGTARTTTLCGAGDRHLLITLFITFLSYLMTSLRWKHEIQPLPLISLSF